jgi:hypothetical protein
LSAHPVALILLHISLLLLLLLLLFGLSRSTLPILALLRRLLCILRVLSLLDSEHSSLFQAPHDFKVEIIKVRIMVSIQAVGIDELRDLYPRNEIFVALSHQVVVFGHAVDLVGFATAGKLGCFVRFDALLDGRG